MKLKQAASDAKVALSDADATDVLLPLITAEISIEKTVTRNEFEALIKPLVESTAEQIDTALKDAELTSKDLQKIILVGGTTRIPFVRQFVEEKTGLPSDASGHALKPELMVVCGAAVQGAIISGVIQEENSVVLSDVCPFTLGVRAVTFEGFHIDPLIRKNVSIPYEFSKVYTAMYEYQREILFEIYQGESKCPQENTRIGELSLDKLPRRQKEKARAEVTFSYDINGILHVKARALGNDTTAATIIDINNNDRPARPAVKLSEWEKAPGASKYRPLIKKVLKVINEYTGEEAFQELELFIPLDHCNELKTALILGNQEATEKYAEELKDFLEIWKEEEKDIGKNLGSLFDMLKDFDED
jgi:molecular chaperone DnaK